LRLHTSNDGGCLFGLSLRGLSAGGGAVPRDIKPV